MSEARAEAKPIRHLPRSIGGRAIDDKLPIFQQPAPHPLTAGGDHFRRDAQSARVPPASLTADGGQHARDTQRLASSVSFSNGGGGQARRDAHLRVAAAPSNNEVNGHVGADAQMDPAKDLTHNEAVGHGNCDAQTRTADSPAPICDRLRELHRQRQDLHRAEKSLTLQIKAKCRRLCDGDKKEADVLYRAISGRGEHEYGAYALAVAAPFIQARALLLDQRSSTEKAMSEEAKKLPISKWTNDISGVGIASLAAIVGEAGDIGSYATVSKLWKRMGLAVINGERQRKKAGAEAIEHGYSPSRRSVMWNVGQCIFKAQSARIDKETGEIIREAGKYRQIYDARKDYELPRVETKGHAHNRAVRYMEKSFLKDLWRAWRAA